MDREQAALQSPLTGPRMSDMEFYAYGRCDCCGMLREFTTPMPRVLIEGEDCWRCPGIALRPEWTTRQLPLEVPTVIESERDR